LLCAILQTHIKNKNSNFRNKQYSLPLPTQQKIQNNTKNTVKLLTLLKSMTVKQPQQQQRRQRRCQQPQQQQQQQQQKCCYTAEIIEICECGTKY